jgi:DNA-binding NtrC family response regulator
MSASSSRGRDRGRVLVVDDDRAMLTMISEFMQSLGHQVESAASLAAARRAIHASSFDLILSDLMLDDGTGIDLLRELRRDGNGAEVIIMTGHGGIEAAIEATRAGAYDYITKPVALPRLQLDVENALEKLRLQRELESAARESRVRFGDLLGVSSEMQQLFALLARVSQSESNLLLVGESGTGKDVAARAVHAASGRRAGPFVAVHCGALPAELLESELFGHVKGAFTSAERARSGRFVAAHGGTIFLDELGTAPLPVQVKLLRVLQHRVVCPVGSEVETPIDVRVIAATNADLEAEIAAGRFRQDLYYRLATFVVRMPPLRERPDDIPLLTSSILKRLAERFGRRAVLAPAALARLVSHAWPGNVRELEHLLEQAMVLSSGGVIRADQLPLITTPQASHFQTLEELEVEQIRRALVASKGNKRQAARLLGIPRASLYRKLERFGIEFDEELSTDSTGVDRSQGRRDTDAKTLPAS